VVAAASQNGEQALIVVEATETISGVLVDGNSQALRGTVQAQELDGIAFASVQTDQDGVFILPDLVRGDYEVYGSVDAPEGRLQSARAVVKSGSDDLLLAVEQPGTLLVRPMEEETGAPRTGAMLLTNVGGEPIMTLLGGPEFVLKQPPGSYWLTVRSSDGFVGTGVVVVKAGEETRLELPMKKGALFSVLRRDGGPPAILRVLDAGNICVRHPMRSGERCTFVVPRTEATVELSLRSSTLFSQELVFEEDALELEIE